MSEIRWIVGSRPKVSGLYLLTVKGRGGLHVVVDDFDSMENRFDAFDWGVIVAWAALPFPYRGDAK